MIMLVVTPTISAISVFCESRLCYPMYVLRTCRLIPIQAFSESLFPFFRDEGGTPRNERDREGFPLRSPDGRYASDGVARYYHHATWEVATTNETLIQPHFVKMIVTPNVVVSDVITT